MARWRNDRNDQYVLDNVSFGRIDDNPIHGRGLFTTHQLPNDMILGVLDGQIMSWLRYNELRAQVREQNAALFFEWNALSETTLLVRPFRTKYSCFINRSREPSLALQRSPLRIAAMRSIKKGKKLLLDYRKEPLSKEYLDGHGNTYL